MEMLLAMALGTVAGQVLYIVLLTALAALARGRAQQPAGRVVLAGDGHISDEQAEALRASWKALDKEGK